MRKRRIPIGVYCVLVLCAFARPAVAQEEISVDFAVPAGVTIVFPDLGSGEPGDLILYTGKPGGGTNGGECVTDNSVTYPIQNVVVVGPRGSRPARTTEIVNIVANAGQPSMVVAPEFAPGTRVATLQPTGDCFIDGVAYKKYRGTVD